MNFASRLSPVVTSMPASGIRRFFDIAAEMDNVISLGVGEPDFATPQIIRAASIDSLHKGLTSYTSNSGLLELRQAIVKRMVQQHNVEYNPKTECLITVGVSEALDIAMRALLNSGDEVLIPEPCYVSYNACVLLAGGVPVPVPTTMEDEFRLTVDKLEPLVTKRTKVLLIGYPNNPTGAIMPREELLKIADFAEKHDLIVISDEIYADLTFDGVHTAFNSLPRMKDRTILLNGFSKSYAMTGLRVGYALANEDFIGAMTKIHQYTMLCATTTSQIAALEALKNGENDMLAMVKEYDRRRKIMVNGFKSMNLACFEPKGAFYIFPCIKETGLTSMEFAEKILFDERLALVPGDAFGKSGEGFIRCSYASSSQHLVEALERIEHFLKKYR